MNTPELQLPEQCRNCDSLRERIKYCAETTAAYTKAAIDVSTEIEQLETAMDENAVLSPDASLHTVELMGAARLIGRSLLTQTQHEMEVARLFCEGTSDPTADQLLPCQFIKSALS